MGHQVRYNIPVVLFLVPPYSTITPDEVRRIRSILKVVQMVRVWTGVGEVDMESLR